MKPVTTATAPARAPLLAADDEWRERAGRLFGEFERSAKAMVVRAFRGAFCADELDDIYASAWVGTLRALAGRHAELADDEIRSYLLTAVANQAGKELRRRRRKPTAPLELVDSVPDQTDGPEERVASEERSRITRDLLTSLPPRRRAVMLLRYGWGLEPSQVCGLIAGLSPRAYRKEVTRGVDELAQRMRAVESGRWCSDREPVLKAFVAGVAEEDEARQARAHLAHCRPCSDFVARLAGHLHDVGGSVATLGAIDGLDGHLGIGDRLVELGDRAAGLVARGSSGAEEVTGQIATAGGLRGAGAAGAGVLAKLATVGAAGKVAIACVGGGIAATACVAAGVTPFGTGGGEDSRPAHERPARDSSRIVPPPTLNTEALPSQVGNESAGSPPASAGTGDGDLAAEPAPRPEPEPEPAAAEADAAVPTVAPTAPPQEQEFGVAAAAATPPTESAPAPASGDDPSSTQAAHQEFGP